MKTGICTAVGVVGSFIANETISIIENAGLMGVPIPAVVAKAIDILKQKAEGDANTNPGKE